MTEDKDRENPNLVTITKAEYMRLKADARWLAALNAAGVDNWGGMEVAIDITREWNKEHENQQ